jgi:hypothetical protein
VEYRLRNSAGTVLVTSGRLSVLLEVEREIHRSYRSSRGYPLSVQFRYPDGDGGWHELSKLGYQAHLAMERDAG